MALITAEQFATFPPDDHRSELIRGRVVELPYPSFRHGLLSASIGVGLFERIEKSGLGTVVLPCGLICSRNPDSVLTTDVMAFLGESSASQEPDGWPETVPDIVVDLVEAFDDPDAVAARLELFRAFGAGHLFVVDVNSQDITLFRPGYPAKRQRNSREIDFSEIIPGFRLDFKEVSC